MGLPYPPYGETHTSRASERPVAGFLFIFMGIFIQTGIVILGLVAIFGKIGTLFVVVGFLSILIDLVGLFSGRLNPLFSIFLYGGGYWIVGNWTGFLWGAFIGQAIEALSLVMAFVGGGSYLLLGKVKKLFVKK